MITTIRTRRSEHEEDAQIALMTWLQLQHPAVFEWTVHVPNGGHRSKRTAGRLKAMGVTGGVPDILCFVPNKRWGPDYKIGLAIEMKRKGAPPSATSTDQLSWLAHLETLGWHACVCRGFEEAKTAFEGYLA